MNVLPVSQMPPSAPYPATPVAREQDAIAAAPTPGTAEAQDTSPPSAPSELARSSDQTQHRDATSQEVESARIDVLTTSGAAQTAIEAGGTPRMPNPQDLANAVQEMQVATMAQPAAAAGQAAVGDTSRDGIPI